MGGKTFHIQNLFTVKHAEPAEKKILPPRHEDTGLKISKLI